MPGAWSMRVGGVQAVLRGRATGWLMGGADPPPERLRDGVVRMRAAVVPLVLWMTGAVLGLAHAQGPPPGPTVYRGAVASAPVAPGVFTGDLRHLPEAREWRPGDPVREVPKRAYPRPRPGPPEAAPAPPASSPPGDETGEKARESPAGPESRVFTTPDLNFDGIGFTGAYPPDTVGDAGPNHYIQMLNGAGGSQVAIYDKSGTLVAGPFVLDSLWTAGGACASGLGDPVVLYDQLASRWLLSEFAAIENHLCVYVSQTADPVAGGWYLYDFMVPQFPDYPKYAVWPDAYYVSTNESSPAVYALDRNRMLGGLAATFQRFTAPDLAGFAFQALTPADHDGPTAPPPGSPGYFVRHRDDEVHNVGPNATQDFLEVWEFHVDWADPTNSTFTGPLSIAIAEFSSELCGLTSFNCFPQPGTTVTLDPLREVVMWRLQYRNFGTHETLVGNLVTDADGEPDIPVDNERGAIRWFELRKSSGGAWTLFQEGTYSPDTTNRWMGSIAMDHVGGIALGYSVSNATTVYPGIRYTGRLAADPAGTLQAETVLVAGAAAQTASVRWGDYSAMAVDPADDCTFWFTTEYVPASGQWQTRIATFKFSSCGGGNTAPTISDLAAQAADVNASVGPIAFAIGDAQTPAGDLLVFGASSNVTLVPNGNIVFGGSGADRTVTLTPATNQSGTAIITITASDGSLTANTAFLLTVSETLATLTVIRSGTGGGTVTSSPGGISCGGDCTETYLSGTLVTITATAAPGSVFVGWSGGGCSGTDACTLALTSNATVTAEFDYTFVFTGILALTLNQASFAPGDLLRVDVTVSNPGPEALVDVYFGVLLPPAAGLGCPAADPIAFVAGNFSSIVVTCLSAPPESFPPLLGSFPIPAGLPPTAFPDFFTFGWTPDLPAGPYTFFLVLTPPDAFADGSVDPVDLLVVTAAGVTFAP